MWGFPKIAGYVIGGPKNKDHSIWGSILGSPYFGKLPCTFNNAHEDPEDSIIDVHEAQKKNSENERK